VGARESVDTMASGVSSSDLASQPSQAASQADDQSVVGPSKHCSPRRRMPCNSRRDIARHVIRCHLSQETTLLAASWDAVQLETRADVGLSLP